MPVNPIGKKRLKNAHPDKVRIAVGPPAVIDSIPNFFYIEQIHVVCLTPEEKPRIRGNAVNRLFCKKTSGKTAWESAAGQHETLCFSLVLRGGRRLKHVSRVPGRLAQLAERRLYTANAGGSSPSAPTIQHQRGYGGHP